MITTTTFTIKDYAEVLTNMYTNFINLPENKREELIENTHSILHYIINKHRKKTNSEIDHLLKEWQENGNVSDLLNYIQPDLVKEGTEMWRRITPKIEGVLEGQLRDLVPSSIPEDKKENFYWFLLGILSVIIATEGRYNNGLDTLKSVPTTISYKTLISLFFLMKLID